MRKLVLIIVAIVFTTGAFAQEKPKYKVGNYYVELGGIVIFLWDSDDVHGLMCSPSDILNSYNGPKHNWDKAISACKNYKGKGGAVEWYLPSKGQMELIIKAGIITEGKYWTSAEVKIKGVWYDAWFYNCKDGKFSTDHKEFPNKKVRAVRAF